MLDRLRAKLARGGLLRAMLVVAGGTAGAQALVMAAQPLLTRLYTPEAFGTFAVFFSLLSIVGASANLRYEVAIPLAADERGAADTLVACMLAAVAVTGLLFVLVLIFGDQLAAFANTPDLEPLLWALPIGALAMGLFNAANFWAIRRRAFASVTHGKLAQSVGQIGWQVGQGMLQHGPVGLVIGYVFGTLAGAAGFMMSLSRADWATIRATTLDGARAAALRWKRFPMFSMTSLLLNNTAKMLPAVLLAALYGPVVAGLFGLGQRIVFTPVRLLGYSVAQVYIGEAPRLARSEPAALRRLFRRTILHLTWVGALAIGALAIPGPWLFGIVFGKEWTEAGTYLQVLAPMFLVHFVVYPISQTLNIFERQDLNLAWDVGNLLAMAASFLLAWKLGWSPIEALICYSAAMSLTYLSALVLADRVIRTHVAKPLDASADGSGVADEPIS